MSRQIIEVTDESQIQEIAELANEIWHEHYCKILSQEQIVYMLEKYQSALAIRGQIDSGYRYFLVDVDGEVAGYCSVRYDRGENRLFLSKIYIREKNRGTGLGSVLFELAIRLAKEDGLAKIWLTVNRYNRRSINFYQKKGFVIDHEEDKEIGNGFVMNDYIMEYLL